MTEIENEVFGFKNRMVDDQTVKSNHRKKRYDKFRYKRREVGFFDDIKIVVSFYINLKRCEIATVLRLMKIIIKLFL